jgi:hypothetical protein
VTNLNYTATLNIRFRIADIAGNLGTGNTGTFLYDATGPSAPVTQSPISGAYLNTGNITFLWSTGSDAGIGQSGYVYQIST